MTTQPEFTDEQIQAMLEQIAAKGGTETLKMVRDTATTMVKETTKANHDAEVAESLRIHKEKSVDARVAFLHLIDASLPDDGSKESKNQAGTCVFSWFRNDNGKREVSVALPKLKSQSSSGERLKGTKFVPLHAKLCLGDSSQTENMEEYLGWFGITNVGASAHDKLKKLVEALNTPGSHVKVGTATVDNLIIKHGDINGGNPTRLCDHYHIAYDSK